MMPVAAALLAAFTLSATAQAQAETAKAKYEAACEQCHSIDSYNPAAPTVGDSERWRALVADKGLEALVSNAMQGFGTMPPGGQFCPDCSRDDFKAVVRYMAERSHY